jgi:hypothetical protein
VDAGFIDLDMLLTRVRHAQSTVYCLDAIKPAAEREGWRVFHGRPAGFVVNIPTA